MASVISCCLTKYNALDVANFPGNAVIPIYFHEAPLVVAGVQIFPPYVVLKDGGGGPQYDFEYNGVESQDITFTVFCPLLSDVDLVVNAIRFNGGTPAQALGFDFGDLPGLDSGTRLMELRFTKEQRSVAGVGRDNQRVHACEVGHRLTIQRS